MMMGCRKKVWMEMRPAGSKKAETIRGDWERNRELEDRQRGLLKPGED